ncbi:tail protein [Ruegeria sp. ANG-R]|uniref:tail protein n=1 Tax=Ruegeria sp. ANG-R TaxID=1577903 RepID=UPI00057F9C09|nr:tail protein [Ruegeria sp. ANG-R]KIC38158.1 tail protein [Ruegeria sp. ANG-R]
MPPAPYYGVEVIETGPGSATVRIQPVATAFLIGTAPIDDVHGTVEERANYIQKPIIIKTREEAAAAFGAHKTGFTIPSALDAIFDQAGPKGVGEIEVVNVYDPVVHTGGVGDVTNVDIIGAFSPSGQPSGLKLAYDSYQRFGRFSKILLAPGFTGLTGIRAELETICNRIRARAILDTPTGVTPQQVREARGPSGSFDLQFSNRRLVPVWPHMRVADTANAGQTRLDPYSARFAGVWLKSIMEYGYHHSPSNRPILGIEDSETPVLYIPGDATSDVQGLRDAGIVTVEERWGKGPHVSGNRSSAWPTDTDMRNFLHVQLTEDVLDEGVIAFLDQFKDRNGNPARIEFIEDGINDWLKSLMIGDDPILSGGQFRFDRTRTTNASVAQGQYYWRLTYAPIGVMERITVDRNIDLNLLGNALQLAA